VENPVECPICSRRLVPAGTANYYDADHVFATSMSWCRSCDAYIRGVGERDLNAHYYAASYVQPDREARFKAQRQQFFAYITTVIEKHANGPQQLNVGDFGASYGHLLDELIARGHRGVGIELNRDLVASGNQRGLTMVENLGELAAESFDAFAMIDSLYCLPDPVDALRCVHGLLKPGGVLVTRITNRTHIARNRARITRKNDYSMLGDATVSFSERAVRRAMNSAGFELETTIGDIGIGKQGLRPSTMRLYGAGRVLTRVLPPRWVAPGLITVSRKR
jgi:2-polyprenyl-3-methyl-5-hydroxy-6-metoxy-1,4-benzoquinol methylase